MAFPEDEVRATVDEYLAVRAAIEAGDATWTDLARFFTDDAVYIDPAWGRIQGIDEIGAFLDESMRGLEDWRFPVAFAAIDGDRIAVSWTQVLPSGHRQSGVSTLRYAGGGKFDHEEDLLNMVHVLEDLKTSGWRPGPSFQSPPPTPDRDASLP
ncbi:MAG: nuclear transport factor 2 family protein [Acidimicrobiia bacterium]|nr:nuclear transport factor 2 family protein [Acidimicrobiia bacterium]